MNKDSMDNNKNKQGYIIPNGEFKALVGDVAWLKKNMSEIVTALLGNEYHEKGWIDRVRHLEEVRLAELNERIQKLEKFRWTVYGAASVITSAVAVLYLLVA